MNLSMELSTSYLFEPIDVVTLCTLWWPSCTVHITYLKFLQWTSFVVVDGQQWLRHPISKNKFFLNVLNGLSYPMIIYLASNR